MNDHNRKDCLSHWMNALHNRAEGKMGTGWYDLKNKGGGLIQRPTVHPSYL